MKNAHEKHQAMIEAQKFWVIHEHSIPHAIDIVLKVSSEVGRIINLIS